MNSRNMPEEEELDQMFRQAADLYQPEFDPEAWRAMEAKLDKPEKPKGFIYRWGKSTLLGLLLALTGVLWYHKLLNQEPEKAGIATQKAPINNNTTKPAPSAGTKQKAIPGIPKFSGKSGFPENQTKVGELSNYSPDNSDGVIHSSAGANKVVKKSRGNPNKLIITSSNKIDKNIGIVKPENNQTDTLTGNTLAVNPEKPSISLNEIAVTKPGQDSVINILKTNFPLVTDSIKTPVNPQSVSVLENVPQSTNELKHKPNPDSANTVQKESRASVFSRVGLTVVLGPDFSTVGFVNPEKVSTNYGLIVSYHFNKRWSIATGIVKARKVYGAKPEDYHPGAYYWNGRHIPDRINAVCEVLDVPLNIRYNFVVLPRQGLFVQTGLSSYLMQHEDYRYDYENYGKPYSTHWIVTKQNQHLFKVLNVSAGYNRQLGPGITVGAEPFLKIPLAGIGAGKVNLTSMGALISIGYRFH